MNEKYLLIKGREGFGNRILSAITGIVYGELSNRKIIIDWSDEIYSDNGKNVFHDFFDCHIYPPNRIIPKTDSVHPKVWLNNLDCSSIKLSEKINTHCPRASSADLRNLDYNEDLVVIWMCIPEIYLIRKFFAGKYEKYKKMSDYKLFKHFYKKYFKLKPAISIMVNNFKKENFNHGNKTIGVHVRYTDKKVNLSKILSIVKSISKKENKTKLFLSTDNKDVIKIFKDKGYDLITTDKWFPKKGETMHQSLDCPSHIQNGIEALMDMYLLAQCDYLVYNSNSTFAYISSLISDIPKENKFNIYKKKIKELIPKTIRRMIWERLEKLQGIA